MSLLPGQILPQSAPLGTLNEDGTVTAEQNWWLFFYNIALNSIGASASIPDAALELWISNQIQAAAVPPKPVAQPAQSISVGASPFTYTAPADGAVTVTGPMESSASAATPSIALIRQSVTTNAGFLNGTIPVRRADKIRLTYVNSVAPTMTFLPA